MKKTLNGHCTSVMRTFISAYHDGELRGRRLERVEAHLAQCELCREELASLRSLSTLLHVAPEADTAVSEDRFVSQVGLRLAHRPTQPAWQRAVEAGWRLTPLGLLGAWAFIQTAFIVAVGLVFIADVSTNQSLLSGILPTAGNASRVTALLGALGVNQTLLNEIQPALHLGNTLGWSFALSLALLLAVGLLYWSWLASWWVRHQHQQNGTV